jgi:hypothetical protein
MFATPRIIAALLVVGLSLAAGSSARAYDITGHWTGTYKCKGTFDGEKDSYVDTLEADFTQGGGAVGANVVFTGTPFNYSGVALPSAAKPDGGDLMLVICGTDDVLGSPQYDELTRLKVTTKPAKGTGTISGESLYVKSGPLQAYACKWKLKRTTTSAPAVPTSCP